MRLVVASNANVVPVSKDWPVKATGFEVYRVCKLVGYPNVPPGSH